MKLLAKWNIFRIVLIYSFFGGLWIYLSDSALGLFVADPSVLAQISIYKGLLFISLTATLLYFLIARYIRQISREVAERKEIEEELRASKVELEEAQLLAGIGHWVFDPTLDNLTWSKGMFHLWAVDSSKPPPKPSEIFKRIHLADARALQNALRSASEGGGPFTFELGIDCFDSSQKTILTRFVPEEGDAGPPFKIRGTDHDITERKRSEESLRLLERQFQQAQKLESLGVLTGGIAHDFNNILSIVIGHCSIARANPELASDKLERIQKAADRGAALCRQMLTYAEKNQATRSTVNFGELIGDMMQMLGVSVHKTADVSVSLFPEPLYVNADPTQLRQIVMNLIINASEALKPSGGEVKIKLLPVSITPASEERDYFENRIGPGDYACLQISDTGCGMSLEARRRIFEPFFTTKFTGRGLGMSAVLGIIRSHAGYLQLWSEEGAGTTFKVYIPVTDSTRAANVVEAELEKSQNPRLKGTVLVVEDEEELRFIASSTLEDLGLSVLEASNGRDALELFTRNADTICLVVTDLGMPLMDGYELLQKLKALKPTLPIIISSGFSDADITSRIPSSQVAGVLSKPYGPDQLKQLVVNLTSTPAYQ